MKQRSSMRWLLTECEAPDVDPFSFLGDSSRATGAGEPRAYWRIGSRWEASRGALAQIDSRELGGDDVCTVVREAAMDLLGTPSTGGGEPSPAESSPAVAPRFYGGLAFDSRWSERDRREGGGPWAEFPAARFFLPAYELAGGEGPTRLRAWRPLGESADPESERDEVLEDLHRLRRRLAGAVRHGPRDGELRRSERVVRESVTRADWRDSVERVRERIRIGDVQKVVLSRAVELRLQPPADPLGAVENICRADPAANVFAFQFGRKAAFVGASPEVLGSLRGHDFRTMAVAGSTRRGEDPDTDERLGQALRESPKDGLEHSICVRELRDRLGPLTTRLDVDAAPRLHRLAEIQHLRTDLAAEVPRGTHILDLLSVLHPTAAVCGRPRETAVRVLAAEEPESRGWYAGAVGWFDGAGNGDFVPGLRCALFSGPAVRLFAGAGIVEASGADAEWEETNLKLRTVGRVLGLGEVG